MENSESESPSHRPVPHRLPSVKLPNGINSRPPNTEHLIPPWKQWNDLPMPRFGSKSRSAERRARSRERKNERRKLDQRGRARKRRIQQKRRRIQHRSRSRSRERRMRQRSRSRSRERRIRQRSRSRSRGRKIGQRSRSKERRRQQRSRSRRRQQRSRSRSRERRIKLKARSRSRGRIIQRLTSRSRSKGRRTQHRSRSRSRERGRRRSRTMESKETRSLSQLKSERNRIKKLLSLENGKQSLSAASQKSLSLESLSDVSTSDLSTLNKTLYLEEKDTQSPSSSDQDNFYFLSPVQPNPYYNSPSAGNSSPLSSPDESIELASLNGSSAASSQGYTSFSPSLPAPKTPSSSQDSNPNISSLLQDSPRTPISTGYTTPTSTGFSTPTSPEVSPLTRFLQDNHILSPNPSFPSDSLLTSFSANSTLPDDSFKAFSSPMHSLPDDSIKEFSSLMHTLPDDSIKELPDDSTKEFSSPMHTLPDDSFKEFSSPMHTLPDDSTKELSSQMHTLPDDSLHTFSSPTSSSTFLPLMSTSPGSSPIKLDGQHETSAKTSTNSPRFPNINSGSDFQATAKKVRLKSSLTLHGGSPARIMLPDNSPAIISLPGSSPSIMTKLQDDSCGKLSFPFSSPMSISPGNSPSRLWISIPSPSHNSPVRLSPPCLARSPPSGDSLQFPVLPSGDSLQLPVLPSGDSLRLPVLLSGDSLRLPVLPSGDSLRLPVLNDENHRYQIASNTNTNKGSVAVKRKFWEHNYAIERLKSENSKLSIICLDVEYIKQNNETRKDLTQIGCSVLHLDKDGIVSNSDQTFFRVIQPPRMTEYLSMKMRGDLLKSLHIQQNQTGQFEFRDEFEIINEESNKIKCISEKEALDELANFVSNFASHVLVSLDEETIKIIQEKVTYISSLCLRCTSWNQLIVHLKLPEEDISLEFEDWFAKNMGSKDIDFISQNPHALDISSMLMKALKHLVEMKTDCNIYQIMSRISFPKGKNINPLNISSTPIPPKISSNQIPPETFEYLEISNSLRPHLTPTIYFQSVDVIDLSSDSDDGLAKTSPINWNILPNNSPQNKATTPYILGYYTTNGMNPISIYGNASANVTGYYTTVQGNNPNRPPPVRADQCGGACGKKKKRTCLFNLCATCCKKQDQSCSGHPRCVQACGRLKKNTCSSSLCAPCCKEQGQNCCHKGMQEARNTLEMLLSKLKSNA